MTHDTARLIGRLENWKFGSATSYVRDAPTEVSQIVMALADTYGDVGWFNGTAGVLVGYVVQSLVRDLKEAA